VKQVTRLVIQQRDKERVNVYLDGEFAFGLALMEAVHLKVGQTLTDEQIADLRDEDQYHKAYSRALDFISRRPRSRREVETYLKGKTLPDPLIERVMRRLTDAQLLDDLSFAHFWIENRDNFRPRGARALRWELRQKGLDETIINEALASSDLNEEDSAFRVGAKQLSRLRSIEDRREFQQKLATYLARRGFGWETIRTVSEQLWEARNEPDLDYGF
jgi:regulatory protein